MNKKNFLHKNNTYTVVYGVLNYIEYYVPYKKSDYLRRKRIFKGLQDCNNFTELYTKATDYIVNHLQVHHDPIKLNVLCDYVERNKYKYKCRTHQQIIGIVNRYNIYLDNNEINPLKVDYLSIKAYIKHLNEAGLSNNTIASIIVILSSIYNGLKKENVIKYNYFIDIEKIKRNPTPKKNFNDLQISEIKKYCLCHNTQMWLAIQLIYSCYIRPNELRLLTCADIDLEENTITVNSKISKNGKNEKVIIPNFLATQLQFIKAYPMHYYLITKSGTPGETNCPLNFINDSHRLVLQTLKIKGNYSFYSWKHTGVIAAVKAGINLKELQLQLRHSSLEMVNIYLKNLGILDSDNIRNNFPSI
jgi:integrase